MPSGRLSWIRAASHEALKFKGGNSRFRTDSLNSWIATPAAQERCKVSADLFCSNSCNGEFAPMDECFRITITSDRNWSMAGTYFDEVLAT